VYIDEAGEKRDRGSLPQPLSNGLNSRGVWSGGQGAEGRLSEEDKLRKAVASFFRGEDVGGG
jgi:hypothetical protein